MLYDCMFSSSSILFFYWRIINSVKGLIFEFGAVSEGSDQPCDEVF